jgi:hypothetical protein
MLNAMRRQILDALWPAGLSSRMSVFTILDGARDSRIYGALDGCYQEKRCLYSGDLPWQLQMTAPYLVKLDQDDRFTTQLLDNGWGGSWGVFLRTETGSQHLCKHLRGLLRVKDEAGRRLIFRYYDPRVLRIYLPTCRPLELETVFGPVAAYLAEGERPSELIEFARKADALISRHISLDAAPASR